jgi:Peptidase C10 family/Spi protease inhibitor/Carboxypeptidase regulatory-like domain
MKGPEKTLRLCFALRVYLLALLCLLQGSWCATVWANPVPSSLAHKAVNKWLAKEAKPMGSPLGSEIERVDTFTDSNGQPVYYVVGLKPNGFVVVSADDLVEPIVCFSSGGRYDSSAHNPLVALVSRDIPARVNASRSIHAKLLTGSSTKTLTTQQAMVYKSGEKAFGKWTELLASSPGLATYRNSISDVRVSPLLSTKWGQDVDICGDACYNYYTPPYGPGDTDNYPAGCVATAMAQYMRFWQYPTSGIGAQSFTIYVDCENYSLCDLCDKCEQPANLRGGDGLGGPYDWSQMPLYPDCSTTDAQRQAIGALVYDAGVAVGMDYESGGSGANMSDAAVAMVYTFGYSNAIFGYNNENNIRAGLNAMINPNLDSGNPVMLGIYNSSDNSSGHAVVADGYGYQSSTLYHHLNMGWDGEDDIWYNLPNIDAPLASFDIIDTVIYNIYISGTGEIISGRVTEADSKTPVSGAAVTAARAGGGTYQTTTNTNGIYAFANVPSNSTYTISVAKAGHSFADQTTNTGQSQDDMATSGNCWAVDFVPTVIVGKCTVSAGSNNNDAISFSGTLSATIDDISAATEIVVDINSADMAGHFVQSFPRNSTTFKNGKFNCTITSNPFKASFALNTNTSKFSFTAKNVDLSGLSCPLTALIEIGGYNAETDINEAIVNSTKPIPINLLIGVKNSLRVDKSKFTRNKTTSRIIQLAISGGFSVGNLGDANMADNNSVVELAGQTFTIPKGSFKPGKNKFTCSKVNLYDGVTIIGIATATFDFNKCTFTLTIKSTDFPAAAGPTEFDIDFASFSGSDVVTLPP